MEELLLENGAFRAGRYALRRVVRTNSDHLMQQMLRDTALCNVGSYWLPEPQRERGFSMAVIEGFEQSVSFGRLQNEGAALSEQAEGFLALLREAMRGGQGNRAQGPGGAGSSGRWAVSLPNG